MFEYHHKTAPWEGHPPHPPLPMRPHEPPPPHWQGPPPPRSSEPPPAPYYELPAGVMVPLVPVRQWQLLYKSIVITSVVTLVYPVCERSCHFGD